MALESDAEAAGYGEPHLLDRLHELCGRITRPIAFVAVLGMLVVSGITIVDILLRWLANTGITALNEIVAQIFAVTITACLPFGMARGIHLKLDLLEKVIVGRLAAWVEAVGMGLVWLTVTLLAWRVVLYAGTLHGRTTVILGWPLSPSMYAVGALLAAAALVQMLVVACALRRAVRYVPRPDAPESSRATWAVVVVVALATLAALLYGATHFAVLARLAIQSPGVTIALFCAVMWILLLLLVPLSAVMGLMGITGTALFIGTVPALSTFATEVADFLGNSQVAILPLFLMMGSFAAVAGLADDMYGLAHALLSRLPGGLAMATIGGCAGFGAMTGSTVATAALIGRVALPEMRERGYSPALATGAVAAGGTLGNLVPPGSGPLVLFALLTEASIGQLFVASLIPSILAISAYLLTVVIFVRVSPGSAPPVSQRRPGELVAALKRCGPITLLFVLVLGGLYTGIFTSTESAAVGAFGAFLMALLRGRLRPAAFWNVMAETTVTTALIYPLIFGALIFAFFAGASALAETVTKLIAGLGWEPLMIVALLLLAFIVLGTFMDSYAIMIITIPIVTPLITGLGYDIVWWGVLNLFVVEIGGISPPFGLTMYVLKSIENVPLAVIFRGVTPFCVAAVVLLVILALFPAITLWLPATMVR